MRCEGEGFLGNRRTCQDKEDKSGNLTQRALCIWSTRYVRSLLEFSPSSTGSTNQKYLLLGKERLWR
jgi:hypothetical protein